MSSDESSAMAAVTTGRGLLRTGLLVLLLSAVMVVAGMALVTLLGRHGDAASWARWGNVGQAFEAVNSVVSALAVAGVLISWAFQSRQMQVAQLALQRAVDAEVRNQHVTLIQMAINDPDLADVWPSVGGKDARTRRQYQYANLLIQHVWLQYTAGIASRDEMVGNLKFLFASPTVRAFWHDTASSRQSIYVEGSAELGLAAVANEIWTEYEAVLACSAAARPPPERHDWVSEDLQRGEAG